MFDKRLFGARLLELGVTRTQVSDIENGKSGTNLDRFYQLCEFYQVSADYLLGITGDPAWRGKPTD